VGTPGGAKLRQLRQASAKTQLWVEAEAELGTGYLQRVESGKVTQPERATVERVLDALRAGYSDRREALELFGYRVAVTPPADEDRAWARAVSRRELHEFPFPAYVLDCTHRLVAWNRHFPRLLGVSPEHARLAQLARRSLLAAWFDPASPLGPLVAEPDVFLPALIRAFRFERQQFWAEPWYAAVLDELMALPSFRHYWDVVDQEPAPAGAARALVPLRLAVPGAGVLQFRLSAEPFTRDARFRVVYYFPADLPTMHQCQAFRPVGTLWRAAPSRCLV
jgi:transcriptional regulator with XRE-family HTH domain